MALSDLFKGNRKLASIVKAKGLLQEDDLLFLLDLIRSRLPLPKGLGKAGLSKESIPSLSRKGYLDACLATNPRKPEIRDLEKIYEQAL
jgi:alcohol dehydrogenase class IV